MQTKMQMNMNANLYMKKKNIWTLHHPGMLIAESGFKF